MSLIDGVNKLWVMRFQNGSLHIEGCKNDEALLRHAICTVAATLIGEQTNFMFTPGCADKIRLLVEKQIKVIVDSEREGD